MTTLLLFGSRQEKECLFYIFNWYDQTTKQGSFNVTKLSGLPVIMTYARGMVKDNQLQLIYKVFNNLL